MTEKTFDICVIGAGSGGLSVAAAAASFGQQVVLIEKGRMGGDCLNYGCVPSKALIAAAGHAHAMTAGAPFGVAPQVPEIDFQRVHDHVHEVIAAIAPADSQDRFEGLGVTVIRAAARFVDHATVEAAGRRITARRFVIATGSTPAIPPIPGLDEVDYLTNETLFELNRCPEHLAIIGGGPIGMEMAQAHRRLGARVTVLEAATPLGRDDPELTATVLEQIAAEGIEVRAGARVSAVRKMASGIEIDVDTDTGGDTIAASHLLVATGRKVTVDGLGLEAAGIAFDKAGIKVDRGLRTSNRKVYAIGDVTGGLQFTHVANYHAGLVVRAILFRLPVRNDTGHIPRVTFTDPELAQVGLTEAEARAAGGEVTVLRWHFEENDRAKAERRTAGMIKAVVGSGGRILGCGIVGPHAGELIQSWGLAMSSGLKIKAMIDQVVAYPTLSEVSRRAAIDYYAGLAERPWVRRIIDLMKLFG